MFIFIFFLVITLCGIGIGPPGVVLMIIYWGIIIYLIFKERNNKKFSNKFNKSADTFRNSGLKSLFWALWIGSQKNKKK